MIFCNCTIAVRIECGRGRTTAVFSDAVLRSTVHIVARTEKILKERGIKRLIRHDGEDVLARLLIVHLEVVDIVGFQRVTGRRQ